MEVMKDSGLVDSWIGGFRGRMIHVVFSHHQSTSFSKQRHLLTELFRFDRPLPE
jgi:hypothetical protein